MGDYVIYSEKYIFLSRRIHYGCNSSSKGKMFCALINSVCTTRTTVRIASIRRCCAVTTRNCIQPLKSSYFFCFPFSSASLLCVTTSPHGGADEARFLALPRTYSACGHDGGSSTCVDCGRLDMWSGDIQHGDCAHIVHNDAPMRKQRARPF